VCVGLQERLRALDDYADQKMGGALFRKQPLRETRRTYRRGVFAFVVVVSLLKIAAGDSWLWSLLSGVGIAAALLLGYRIGERRRISREARDLDLP
jgi:predicted lysophospholipase L1 biosynthesis ABC-type transport system permease subunit